MKIWKTTYDQLEKGKPDVKPFVGQMLAVSSKIRPHEDSGHLYVVTSVHVAPIFALVTYTAVGVHPEFDNQISRKFTREEWDALSTPAWSYAPPPALYSNEMRLPPHHKDVSITAQNLLESTPPPQPAPNPKFYLGDEVLVTYEDKEQLGYIVSCPVTKWGNLYSYQVRFEGNRYVYNIHEYQMRFAHEAPAKKLPTPSGVDVAMGESRSTVTVYDDKEVIYSGPVGDYPVKITGTKDHKIVQGVDGKEVVTVTCKSVDYGEAEATLRKIQFKEMLYEEEPVSAKVECQPGNVNIKLANSWGEMGTPVEEKDDESEGDAMMEFFKGK